MSGRLTHAEINARFVALDGHPILTAAGLDGWLAWAIVKERLWLLCRNQWHEDGGAAQPARAAARLWSGIRQIAGDLPTPALCDAAVLYTPREVHLPDGRTIHPHLGDLAALQAARQWLGYVFGPGARRDPAARGSSFDHDGLGAAAAAIALVVRRDPAIATLTREIMAAVGPALPEMAAAELAFAARDELGRFRYRFQLMRRLLERRHCRLMIVLDPDGKIPEVAAGISLGLPVVEVQHGMFCADEPEYSWTATHRALPCRMPLPDRVVVFGPLWKQQLAAAGYWREDDILEAGNAAVAGHRRVVAGRPPRPGGAPIRLLFPTQRYVRDTALEFWTAVLDHEAQVGRHRFSLRIKVHPDEQADVDVYRALALAHPQRCHLAPEGRDAFEEMGEADMVVGYSSLMMMEAVGLGLPVVALKGGAAREGFAAIYGMPELSETIVEVDNPAAFAALMDELGRGLIDTLAGRSQAAASRVYSFDAPPVDAVLQDLMDDAREPL